MGKPRSHVKVYHCIQCGAEVEDAALFCSKKCRDDWYKTWTPPEKEAKP